jgi:HK97 family phage prohead protease
MNDYPQAASDEAQRALKHKEENDSKCGTLVGWNRARQLANREALSEKDVKDIHSFLSRAKVYDQTKFTDENGKEICGSVMFSAWGGDAMAKWAARKAAKIQENRIDMNNNIEKRAATIEAVQAESRMVTGYAAVFDSDSEDLGGFIEQIERGAFKEAIQTSDVRALFNHDNNFILARTASGTLRLYEDERGLKYEFEAPRTSMGNDLLEMIKRGDISQSSFGFTVDDDEWSNKGGIAFRKIKKVKRLYDVSPVTFPAYPEASVAVRKLEQLKQEEFQRSEEKEQVNTAEIDMKLIEAALKYHA